MDPDYLYSVPLIEAAARSAVHLDREEAIAVGNLSYVRAQRRHNHERGPFDRHLRFRLRKDMQQAVREDSRQRHGLKRDKKTPSLVQVPLVDAAVPGDWTDELSDDALAVVRLAVSSAADLKPAQIRKALWSYLEECGWIAARIAETFKEVGDCLP